MDMTEVERRLLGLDDEIHDLLRYIPISKERDIEVELENYEDMKETISHEFRQFSFSRQVKLEKSYIL